MTAAERTDSLLLHLQALEYIVSQALPRATEAAADPLRELAANFRGEQRLPGLLRAFNWDGRRIRAPITPAALTLVSEWIQHLTSLPLEEISRQLTECEAEFASCCIQDDGSFSLPGENEWTPYYWVPATEKPQRESRFPCVNTIVNMEGQFIKKSSAETLLVVWKAQRPIPRVVLESFRERVKERSPQRNLLVFADRDIHNQIRLIYGRLAVDPEPLSWTRIGFYILVGALALGAVVGGVALLASPAAPAAALGISIVATKVIGGVVAAGGAYGLSGVAEDYWRSTSNEELSRALRDELNQVLPKLPDPGCSGMWIFQKNTANAQAPGNQPNVPATGSYTAAPVAFSINNS